MYSYHVVLKVKINQTPDNQVSNASNQVGNASNFCFSPYINFIENSNVQRMVYIEMVNALEVRSFYSVKIFFPDIESLNV